MKMNLNYLTIAAVVAAVMPAATAKAAIVFSDNFEGDTVGSAPAGWVSNTANLTLGTAADGTTGGGGNNAMDLSQSNSPGAGIPETSIAGFTPVTLNDGDSVVFSFNVAAMTAPTAQDRVFRFGVYNAMNPAATPTVSITGTPEGYAGRLDEGTVATTSGDAWASVGFLGSSTTSTPAGKSLATTTNAAADVTTAADLVTMTLTRVGANITNSITITSTLGTVTLPLGTDSTQAVRTDTGYMFNEIMIGQSGGAALDYHVDNVSVVYNAAAAPEPASLGVLGVGAVALLGRRRKV